MTLGIRYNHLHPFSNEYLEGVNSIKRAKLIHTEVASIMGVGIKDHNLPQRLLS